MKKLLLAGVAACNIASVQAADLVRFNTAVSAVESKVVAWRHDIHRNPELGNREVRTAKLVADHLRRLGLDEVQTGVAYTGVIGVLKGGKPGPVVALRADMDALPVTEQTGLPYASRVTTEVAGQKIGVMHACGHDAHTAMLMGVAEVLAGMRKDIAGTVVFVFQPAEEGPPEGEEGGAKLIMKEGALSGARKPAAMFGLHVTPAPAGTIGVRARGQMAAADQLKLTVHGRQTHGSRPWAGIDPVITAAQIMVGLQMIPARQLDVSLAPSVLTIGSVHGGVRSNIIPDKVEMLGTIRTFEPKNRDELLKRIRVTAETIAASAGASVSMELSPYAPSVYNDPDLTARMIPTLRRAVGDGAVYEMDLVMGSEDFAHYQQQFPGLFVFLGINNPGVSRDDAAPNHSPEFIVNDDALKNGVKTLGLLALEYLEQATR